MNSTYAVGIGALILAGVFYGQLDGLPGVAQRLPVLLIWLVAILAVLMIIEEALKQRRVRSSAGATSPRRASISDGLTTSASTQDATPAGPEDELPPIQWKAAVSFALALVAYVWLIPTAGYIVTTVAFVFGVLLFSKTIRPGAAVLIAVGLTIFVWLVFIWALGLPVPLMPWLK